MSNNLNRDEKNKELLLKYNASKDKAIYDELFLNNVSLVRYFINYYIESPRLRKKAIMDEYFSVGCIGLHNAIVNFDIERMAEISFSTFAFICVRNEVLKEIREVTKQERYVYVNTKLVEESSDLIGNVINDETNTVDYVVVEKIHDEYKNKKIKDAISKLDDKSKEIIELAYGFNNKKRMTFKEISIKLGLPLIEVNKILLSIRETLKQDLLEFKQEYSLQRKETRLGQLYSKYGKEQVNLIINSLGQRAQTMLKLYYGLENDQKMTIKELAEVFNCSISNVTSTIYCALNKTERNILNPRRDRLVKLYYKYGKEKVEEAINSLDKNKQLLLKAYYREDGKKVTMNNLAHNLGCTINVVSSKIYNSLDIIEKMLIKENYKRYAR